MSSKRTVAANDQIADRYTSRRQRHRRSFYSQMVFHYFYNFIGPFSAFEMLSQPLPLNSLLFIHLYFPTELILGLNRFHI